MTTRTSPVPATVQAARVLLGLIALAHLVIATVMGTRQDSLREQIAAGHPEFDAAEAARSAHLAVVSGAVFHGLLLVLCVLLGVELASGRPWPRRLAIISQLLSVVFGVVSWTSSPMFHAVVPVLAVAQLAVVVLLWAPASARDFFTAAR